MNTPSNAGKRGPDLSIGTFVPVSSPKTSGPVGVETAPPGKEDSGPGTFPTGGGGGGGGPPGGGGGGGGGGVVVPGTITSTPLAGSPIAKSPVAVRMNTFNSPSLPKFS